MFVLIGTMFRVRSPAFILYIVLFPIGDTILTLLLIRSIFEIDWPSNYVLNPTVGVLMLGQTGRVTMFLRILEWTVIMWRLLGMVMLKMIPILIMMFSYMFIISCVAAYFALNRGSEDGLYD